MLIFIKEALKGFVKQGSIFPSSLYLTRQMIRPIITKPEMVIVELGAGSGAFTRQLLKKLPKDGKLLIFEINKNLADHLKEKITDSRAFIITDDARYVGKHLQKLHVGLADYIVSGLPIGNFNQKLRNELLVEINHALKKDGVYVQFQYFLANWLEIRRKFKAKIIAYEVRNMPPAFVYECHKKQN